MKKAIERLKKRFSSKKIYINENDISCLNEIIDYYNLQQTKIVNGNRHLAKFILYFFLQELNRTGRIDFARRSIVEVMRTPTNAFIDNFTMTMFTDLLTDKKEKEVKKIIINWDEKKERANIVDWIANLINGYKNVK